jgi:hypothetical protein
LRNAPSKNNTSLSTTAQHKFGILIDNRFGVNISLHLLSQHPTMYAFSIEMQFSVCKEAPCSIKEEVHACKKLTRKI